MKSKGFTIIELMIVVAIVGVLASVVVGAYQSYGRNNERSGSFIQTQPIDPQDNTDCIGGVLHMNGRPVVHEGKMKRC